MAELIDKQMVINVVAKTTIGGYFSRANEKVDQLPYTTEAEIRNKAIDEFAEKLKECVSEDGTLYAEYIDEIADQLKEE
jgi:hypothetical protein